MLDRDYKIARELLDELTLFDLLGRDMGSQARKTSTSSAARGSTVRKTADVIIAAFCIERVLPLLFSDGVFKPFVA